MRISTYGSFVQGVRLMQQAQAALGESQAQIASGRRLLRPSDDPIAAAQSVSFRESIGRLDQFQRNSDAARSRLQLEESALNTVTNVMQRVRELALRANNATETRESRKQISIELQEQLADLVQIANQKDGNGRFLFSGNQDGSAPVSNSGSGFIYNGDQGQRLIQIGPQRQVFNGDSGAAVFFNIRNGNGAFLTSPAAANTGSGVLSLGSVTDPSLYDKGQYTVRFIDPGNYEVLDASAAVIATGTYQSGQSIGFQGIAFTIDGQPETGDEFLAEPSRYQSMFQTVQNMVSALDTTVTNQVSQAVLNNALNTSIQEIDVAIGNVSDVRTQIGIRLNAIDGQSDSNNASSVLAKQALSELEDLDYAEALSMLSLQATTLEAAQRSFVVTQRLSLFQFL